MRPVRRLTWCSFSRVARFGPAWFRVVATEGGYRSVSFCRCDLPRRRTGAGHVSGNLGCVASRKAQDLHTPPVTVFIPGESSHQPDYTEWKVSPASDPSQCVSHPFQIFQVGGGHLRPFSSLGVLIERGRQPQLDQRLALEGLRLPPDVGRTRCKLAGYGTCFGTCTRLGYTSLDVTGVYILHQDPASG